MELADEKIKWHPAFAAAMQLELKEYREYLEFTTEYQLTDEPLRIDVLVIKEDIQITKSIGKIFRKYNILEYKSPTDYISVDDYYKVRAYAYLYKALSQKTDAVDIDEMTVTLTSSKYPRKLMDYLKNKKKTSVEAVGDGIYYIKGTDVETQLIVSKELNDNEAKYLKLLQIQQQDKSLMENWMEEYINNIKDPLYAMIMDVLAKANPNKIMEVYKDMRKVELNEDNRVFLLDMMKKFKLDKKLKQEGIDEGIEKGIADTKAV
ncbi:hypothetical protein AB8U03_09575 [Clostridium sp. Mt-5]|uniref:Rho-GAP domain-containing protein n=1 Tax=Clostridium moutaii TaxID=3240932 RepID=A0ABV4BPK3_9CLOT